MIIDNNIITADEGKVLRRISDGFIPGDKVTLGYTYYINNEPLDTPLLEIAEHYEEIPISETITDDDFEEAVEVTEDNTVETKDDNPKTTYLVDVLQKALAEIEELKKRTNG